MIVLGDNSREEIEVWRRKESNRDLKPRNLNPRKGEECSLKAKWSTNLIVRIIWHQTSSVMQANCVSCIGSAQCLHRGPSSSAPSFYYLFCATSCALHTWPSASRTDSWINFWHPRSKRDEGGHSFCTYTEVGSSGRNIHEPGSMHLGSRDLSLSEAFLLEVIFTPPAVLSCSPSPYTEFCVQAVAAAAVLSAESLTLGSSLQHREAFSDWLASVVPLSSPGGNWGGRAVLGKSCHMLTVEIRVKISSFLVVLSCCESSLQAQR